MHAQGGTRMPWRETCPVDERLKFIAAYLRGEISLTRLCAAFSVSRKTGYKWIERYTTDGAGALLDRTRRPHSHPTAVPEEVAELVVGARRCHPFWGPKKLLLTLAAKYPGLDLPAGSTVARILSRRGLVMPRGPGRRRAPPYSRPFLGYDRPNAVWCADFKGHFRMGSGRYVHTLTISDGFSRFLLRCEGLLRTTARVVQPIFESAFREYGLPDAIRTDNGPPFASCAPAGLSHLAIWWIKLGIRPERIQPGRPQQNGRHERMHRTLKAETARPPRSNLKEQQRAFDAFRKEYNTDRPHEALGQRPPATVYISSARPYPDSVPEVEYAAELEIRRVRNGGALNWGGTRWYISSNLSGHLVGLKALDDDTCAVYFGPFELGVLDQRTRSRAGRGQRPTGKLSPIPRPFAPLKLDKPPAPTEGATA